MTAEECLMAVERIRSFKLRAHETRVGRISGALALALGREQSYADMVADTASLHDVGKLAIPESILDKPGKLDAAEWDVMRLHTEHGAEILRAVESESTDLAAMVALTHHECWDGAGYPSGLKAEAIPIEARIVSLADVYDALREVRAYKAPRTHAEVMHMILGCNDGTRAKFDPMLLGVVTAQPDLLCDAYEAADAAAISAAI